MTYLKWLALAVADLIMLVLAILLAPFLPLFAIGRPTLPSRLSWFQTPDNPLDGDAGWKTQHWQWRFKLPTPLATYVGRVGWLWRNPGYGFDIHVLGLTVTDTVKSKGTLPVRGAPPKTGWFFATCAGGFQLYAVKFWPNGKASRVDFGWKLWSAPGVCQFAMTVSPYYSAPAA